MKANNKALVRKGYAAGIGSGMTWGLDAVMLGIAMAMAPFVDNPILWLEVHLFAVCCMMCLLLYGC